jgi:hypothetical protein
MLCFVFRSSESENSPPAPGQNLLIVTVMSFDRAGNIKHNHHVQTRADFLPNSARHCPGKALPVLVCAKRKDSFESVMRGRLVGGMPWRLAL